MSVKGLFGPINSIDLHVGDFKEVETRWAWLGWVYRENIMGRMSFPYTGRRFFFFNNVAFIFALNTRLLLYTAANADKNNLWKTSIRQMTDARCVSRMK